MTAQTDIVNDWHRLFDELGPEHKIILQQTLNTPSFEILLNLYERDVLARLQNLSTNHEATEFKHKYIVLKLKSEFAESLNHFIKTLNIQPT